MCSSTPPALDRHSDRRAFVVLASPDRATHRAIDAARKRKAQAETSLDESDEPTVLEQMHDSMLSSYLARMVGTLPEKHRIAVVLRYQEDMEIEEIAKVLDLNASTVKTHIARGLEMLREKVQRRLGRGSGEHDAI